MKTRLKTSSKIQNQYSILKNRNFLNNQNYVIWNSIKGFIIFNYIFNLYFFIPIIVILFWIIVLKFSWRKFIIYTSKGNYIYLLKQKVFEDPKYKNTNDNEVYSFLMDDNYNRMHKNYKKYIDDNFIIKKK